MKRATMRTTVALAIGGLAATAAPAAHATDAGLRRTVLRHETRVTPLAKAFFEADQALTAGSDTNTASAAAGALRTGLRKFKLAVVPVKTQSDRFKQGKKLLLTAIREEDLGLVQYQRLLDQVAAGAPRETLQDTFTTLNKRIKEGAKDEQAALKLLKIATTS